ncbi:MAG: sodium/solute symporter [Lentisphaerae bacterium]|nr:sodium/solute symporter [Lentisphaerota bacterium]
MDNYINYGIIILYMGIVLGIGFFFSNKDETTEGYLLGGRNMHWLPIGLSMIMTLLSSISLVQIPSEIYNQGWTLFSLSLLSVFTGPIFYLMFVRFYFKLGSFTPYEYLERRYDKTVRTIVAVSAFYARIMYLGMVLYTTSKIFQGAYNWPCWVTILMVGIIGAVYTVMGGMKAVVWTDVIQFVVMAGGMITIVISLNNNIDGGLVQGVVYAWENGHGAPQYATAEFYEITPYVRLTFWLLLWNLIMGGIEGASSDQLNIQRLLSTKDWKTGFKSQLTSTALGVTNITILYIIGFCIYSYFAQNPDPEVTAHGGDIAFFRFIALKLGTPLPGIFMAAMLAAIMSTLDSGMNSMAAVWLKEFHVRFINKKATPQQEMKILKWATIIIGVVAIVFALALNVAGQWLKQSATEVATIFGLLGFCTLPAYLFAVISKRANSTLIWAYTFFATGEAISQNIWYTLSRNAVHLWEADPSVGFGWGGKLPAIYMIVPSVIGILLIIPWCVIKKKIVARISGFAGMFVLGFAFRLFIWWAYSSYFVTDRPLDCSFAFFMPVSFVIAFIALWFCPVQPEKKWRGLTLSTVNDNIISE